MSKPLPRSLLVVLLIGLLLRIAWPLAQPTTSAAIDRLPDQREYLSLGRNLLHNGSLCFVDPRFDQTVYAYRMPGYPLFIAACGGSIRIVRLAQCLVDVSTLLAVFLLATQLSRRSRAGVACAALMAVNPFYVYFSGLVLSETLFAATVIWALWFLIDRKWIIATFFLVAGCYLRPTGLMFIPLVLWSNTIGTTAYRLWDGLRRLAVATFIVLACLFPWAWRNHQMLGQWIWLTTNTGITLYDGFNPASTGSSDQRFVTLNPHLRSINEVERSRYFSNRARDWIGENWKTIPVLSARKILRGWSPIPLSQEFGHPLYRIISAAYSLPFDLLCLLGLFTRRLDRKAKVLIAMPALIVTLAQVMTVGSIRYRMPAEAPLAVLAAVGLVEVVGSKFKCELRTSNVEHPTSK